MSTPPDNPPAGPGPSESTNPAGGPPPERSGPSAGKEAEPGPPQAAAHALQTTEDSETPGSDLHVLHEPIMREKARPADGSQPIPLALIFIFGALLLWGGWYLGEYDGDYREDVFTPKGELALAAGEATVPEVDPMVLGQRVYNNCTACHQSDGKGVAGAFPPLDQSDWVTGSTEVLARILLQGMKGPVEVRGQIYRGVMPAWSQLTDEEIAAVLTYIRASWSNDAAPVAPETVSEIRAETGDRTEAWTADELRALGVGEG